MQAALLLGGAVEPVVGSIGHALRCVVDAGLGGAAGSDDAVDLREALAVAGVAELQPGDGAGADGARVGALRSGDLVEELGLDEEVGAGLFLAGEEGGDAAGVEDVVAQEGKGEAGDLERGGSREGRGGVGAELGGAVGLERETAGPQNGGRQGIKVVDGGERRGTLGGVQSGGIVENSQGAGRLGFCAGAGAGVVLDAVTQGNVLETQAFGRGQLLV